MSAKTGIEWTDATWNPIRGCSRVSEGCRHCYAERDAYRFGGPGRPFEGLVTIGADGKRKQQWNGQIKFVEERLPDPLKWKPILTGIARAEGKLCLKDNKDGTVTVTRERPRRIFVNSMSDLFHENVTDAMLDRIFAVMALCPQHTFQVLTKRPKRMLAYFRNPEVEARIAKSCVFGGQPIAPGYYSMTPGGGDLWEVFGTHGKLRFVDERVNGGVPCSTGEWSSADFNKWPLPNVWLGVSVEDQKAADERIPLLLQTPAAVRFISAEPLLGPVDLTVIPREASAFDLSMPGFERCKGFFLDAVSGSNGVLLKDGRSYEEEYGAQPRLDWVICGGESGIAKDIRPMHPDWVRGLRDQCVAAGVPFFFKQWGEWYPQTRGFAEFEGIAPTTPVTLLALDGHRGQSIAEMDGHSRFGRMVRLGKKAAGHLLDGREWHEFPEVRA